MSALFWEQMCNFQDSERAVTKEEGMSLAKELKCSFLECSAKTRENVQQCFKELILKVSLWELAFLFYHLESGIFSYIVTVNDLEILFGVHALTSNTIVKQKICLSTLRWLGN